jgi:hypothetical protein
MHKNNVTIKVAHCSWYQALYSVAVLPLTPHTFVRPPCWHCNIKDIYQELFLCCQMLHVGVSGTSLRVRGLDTQSQGDRLVLKLRSRTILWMWDYTKKMWRLYIVGHVTVNSFCENEMKRPWSLSFYSHYIYFLFVQRHRLFLREMNSLFPVTVTEAISLDSYHLRGWNIHNTLCYVMRGAGLPEFDSRQSRYYSLQSHAAPETGPTQALIKWMLKERLFPSGWSGSKVKIVTDTHLVAKWRLHRALPSLHCTPSWCRAWAQR